MQKFLRVFLASLLCLSVMGGFVAEAEEPLFADYQLTASEIPASMKSESKDKINFFKNPNNKTIQGNSDKTQAYVTWVEGSELKWKPDGVYMTFDEWKRVTDPNTGTASRPGFIAAKGKTFAIRLKVKRDASSPSESLVLGIGLGNYGMTDPTACYEQSISGTEWTDVKAVVTLPANAVSENLLFGFTASGTKQPGDKFYVSNDLDDFYMQEETISAIEVKRTDTVLEVDKGKTMSFMAEVQNQIGLEAGDALGLIEWKVVSQDRTREITDGFIVNSSNKAATVQVDTAAAGTYTVLARYQLDNGKYLQKGIDFEVLPDVIGDKKADGEYALSLQTEPIDADTNMGLFDTLVLASKLTKQSATVEGGFDWLVLSENRRSVLDVADTCLIITPNETGDKATIELSTQNLAPAVYYIAARPKKSEAANLMASVKITIGDSVLNDIQTGLSTDDKETTAAKLTKYVAYLEIGSFKPIAAVETEDWAERILSRNPSKSEELTTEESIRAFLKETAVLSCLSTARTVADLKTAGILENNAFSQEAAAILKTSEIDKNGVTLFSFLGDANDEAMLTDEGLNELYTALCGGNYLTTESLRQALTANLLRYAVAYPASMGTGYLDQVLTKENLEAAGISGVETYLSLKDKSEIHAAIAGELYTAEELKAVLAAAEEPTGTTGQRPAASAGSGGSSGGGSGSTGKTYKQEMVVSKPTAKENDTVAEMMFPFDDVSPEHWAYSDIYHLAARRIISGKSGSCFAPEDAITREEFVKMICSAFGIETAETVQTFRDTPMNAWYLPYIQAAVSRGIIQGISEEEFGVGQPVSRQDMCVMVVRALGTELTDEDANVSFSDSDHIAPYAKQAVGYLSSVSGISGFDDGSFRPTETCTRAQAAKILRYAMTMTEG